MREYVGGGVQRSLRDVLLQEGSDVGRGESMQCLVCQDEDLKENPLAYREPVELYEERGHMVMFVRPSSQLGSSVLDRLKSGDITVRQYSQDAVTVVKPRQHKGMDYGCGSR